MTISTEWFKKPGDKIDTFTIISPIGAGGMGQVFLCHDDALNRQIAMKIVAKRGSQNESEIARFLQEGRLLAQVHHPNIMSVHTLGEDEECAYLVMEYIEGESLHTLIKQCRLNLHEIKTVMQGVALGLHEAHLRGIVHRDIKPANILVDRHGRAKLIDFGIAKALFSKNEVQTETGTLYGTMNYIAPELFAGADPSPKSDMYSLGLVLYELVTGETPFAAPSRLEVMERIRARSLKYPSGSEPLLPQEFRKLIHQSIQKNPEERIETALQFQEQLQEIDLSYIPLSYSLSLRDWQLANTEEVFGAIRKSTVARSLWPLVLSQAWSKQSNFAIQTHDATAPIDLENLILEGHNLSQSIVDVETLRDEVRKTGPARVSTRNSGLRVTEATRAKHNYKLTSIATAFVMIIAFGFGIFGARQIGIESPPPPREPTNVTSSAGQTTPPQEIATQSPTSDSLFKKYPSVGIFETDSPSPWPPIPQPNPRLGRQLIYREKLFYNNGKIETNRERWTLEEFDGILLKWTIVSLNEDNSPDGQQWHSWYRNNAQLLSNVHVEGSPRHGSSYYSIVGNPDAIFPLSKGKVSVHEYFGETADDGKPFRNRAVCIVGDNELGNFSFGPENVVRVDCYVGKSIKPDVNYYSPRKGQNILFRGTRTRASGTYEIFKEIESIVEGTGESYESHLKTLSAPTTPQSEAEKK